MHPLPSNSISANISENIFRKSFQQYFCQYFWKYSLRNPSNCISANILRNPSNSIYANIFRNPPNSPSTNISDLLYFCKNVPQYYNGFLGCTFQFHHHGAWCYCSCYWISPVRRFQLSKVCRKLLFCFLPISTAQQMLSHQQQLNKQSLASDRKLLFLKLKKRQIWLQIRPKKHNLYMRTSYKRKLIQRRKVLKGETSDIY